MESPTRSTTSTINKPVFFSSLVLVLSYCFYGVVFSEHATRELALWKVWVVQTQSTLYTSCVVLIVLFSIATFLSPIGRLRLGDDGTKPEFSNFAWYSMLFSAGMGIGLVYNGVAEPMLHYADPLGGIDGRSHGQLASAALGMTYFHWGIYPWAIYAVTGLGIAFFSYRWGLPLSLRSMFYPLLGRHIHGWVGHAIDITATFATLFGLAGSLGLGASQVSVGIERVFGITDTLTGQVLIIAIVTAIATLSLLSGLGKGIRLLSEYNIVLAGVLLVLVFALGPTFMMIVNLPLDLWSYTQVIVERTFVLSPDGATESQWMTNWTIPYWAWWIAWAPFVGIFVARISKGRTVREFLGGVILVPTVMSIFWFGFFGNTAIWMENDGAGIAAATNQNFATAVFVMLEGLPWSQLTSLLAVIVVSIFFVTSSDSASFVVDMITSGGHPNPPKWQRIFWATLEGLVAATLLMTGGQQVIRGMQAAIMVSTIPFSYCLLLGLVSLVIGFKKELANEKAV